MKLAAKSFRYKKVSRLPDDHARWQRNARNVLEKRIHCLSKNKRDCGGHMPTPWNHRTIPQSGLGKMCHDRFLEFVKKSRTPLTSCFGDHTSTIFNMYDDADGLGKRRRADKCIEIRLQLVLKRDGAVDACGFFLWCECVCNARSCQ